MKSLIAFALMILSNFAFAGHNNNPMDLSGNINLNCSKDGAVAAIKVTTVEGKRFVSVGYWDGNTRFIRHGMPVIEKESDPANLFSEDTTGSSRNSYSISISTFNGITNAMIFFDWTIRDPSGEKQGLLIRVANLNCRIE